jgi:hypothetical protein
LPHEADELRRRDVARQAGTFGHVADAAANRVRLAREPAPEHAHLAVVRCEVSEQDAQKRRLAGSVRPDERGHAGRNDRVHDGERTERSKGLHHAGQLNEVHRRAACVASHV